MAAPVPIPQIPGAPRQIGIFAPFIAQQPEGLVLKEKVLSLSGDSFDIKTAAGQPIFKVAGKHFSLSGRKELSDMNGNHLFTIRKRLVALHTTFFFEDPSGKEIFETKSSFSIGGAKFTATFIGLDGQPVELKMKGDFFSTSAEIKDTKTDAVVARIDRGILNKNELVFGQQTYMLTVAPGVDMALMAAFCICLDEKKSEGK